MSGPEETTLSKGDKGQCLRLFSRLFFAGVLTLSCAKRNMAFAPTKSIETCRISRQRAFRPWKVNGQVRGSLVQTEQQIERIDSGLEITSESTRTIGQTFDSKNSALKNNYEAKPESTMNISSESAPSIRSKQRMIKAKKLLEMAQVSPSQRLEMEEERRGDNSTFNSINNKRISARKTSTFNNTQDLYEMRMAETFDSVDNLVDSKSLLPGGRWIDEREQLTKNPESSLNGMERHNLAAGKVAEVCLFDHILFLKSMRWQVNVNSLKSIVFFSLHVTAIDSI